QRTGRGGSRLAVGGPSGAGVWTVPPYRCRTVRPAHLRTVRRAVPDSHADHPRPGDGTQGRTARPPVPPHQPPTHERPRPPAARPFTRNALAVRLREAGQTAGNARVGALLARLKTEPATDPTDPTTDPSDSSAASSVEGENAS